MPEETIKPEGTRTKDQKIIDLAIKRLQRSAEANKDNYKNAVDDLKFAVPGGDQWDPQERARREKRGRPVLQVNVMPKYIEQVCGEMRRNKVQIKVRPVDAKADLHIAKIREGMIRNIEYKSNSESIYDQAGEMMVKCGYGAWRVLTVPSEENPFYQEIILESIPNPLAVFMDPDAKDKCFADAEYGFIVDRVLREEFKDAYGFDSPGPDKPKDVQHGAVLEYWASDDTHVAVMEYFYKVHSKKKLAQLSDGQIMDLDEAEKYVAEWKSRFAEEKARGNETDSNYLPEIAKTKEVDDCQIKWVKMTEAKILETGDWPSGKYIPIIQVTGRETNIEGRRIIAGLIRNAKDPQRMKDYWETALAEVVALAPKAQWQLTPEMVKGFEKDYAAANEDNLPYLLSNPDPNMPGAFPKRSDPPQAAPGLFAEVQRADENIRSCLGMFSADVGDQGRELSGAAIYARQIPGDTSTYVFLDNLSKAIAHSGKIVNDLITPVYDTARDARIRNVDGTEAFAPINTTVGKALEQVNKNPQKYSGLDMDKLKEASQQYGLNADFNAIGEGEYGVVVTTGPSFATQRAESASQMVQLAGVLATMNPVDKFFAIKAMDYDGAAEHADAIRKTIPYGILPPQQGEKPPEPVVDPQKQMELQIEQSRLEVQKLDRIVQAEKIKTEGMRQRTELVKMLSEMKSSDIEMRREVMQTMKDIGEYERLSQQQQLESGQMVQPAQ